MQVQLTPNDNTAQRYLTDEQFICATVLAEVYMFGESKGWSASTDEFKAVAMNLKPYGIRCEKGVFVFRKPRNKAAAIG
jgi:hypothetical protein